MPTGTPSTEVSEFELLAQRRMAARVAGWLFPFLTVIVLVVFGIVVDKLDFLPALLRPPQISPDTAVVVMMAGAVLAVPYLWAQWRIRSVSNRLAALVYAPSNEIPGRPYVLLLRSFFLDQTLKAGAVGIWPSYRDNESLQARLAGALGDYEVIKIGSSRPFDWYGGSVISGDADWYSRFVVLAERASLIVMCPVTLSPTSGTYRELSEIAARGWLSKTVLVAPPTRRLVWMWGRGSIARWWTIRRLWEETRQVTATIPGLELPERRAEAGALMLRNGTRWTSIVGVLGRDWDHPGSMKRLLVRGLSSVGPLLSAAHLVKSLLILFLVVPCFTVFIAGLVEMRDGATPTDSFIAHSYLLAAVAMLAPLQRVCRRHVQTRVAATVLAAVAVLSVTAGFLLFDRLSYLYWPVHGSLGAQLGKAIQGAALVAVAIATAIVTAFAAVAATILLLRTERHDPPPPLKPPAITRFGGATPS